MKYVWMHFPFKANVFNIVHSLDSLVKWFIKCSSMPWAFPSFNWLWRSLTVRLLCYSFYWALASSWFPLRSRYYSLSFVSYEFLSFTFFVYEFHFLWVTDFQTLFHLCNYSHSLNTLVYMKSQSILNRTL